MAEHIHAKHYPMPLPVLPRSKQEKEQLHSQRDVASTPLKVNADKPVIAIAAGEEKVLSLLGALRSTMINGLITNEYTAERLHSSD